MLLLLHEHGASDGNVVDRCRSVKVSNEFLLCPLTYFCRSIKRHSGACPVKLLYKLQTNTHPIPVFFL